ncbi:MAG: YkoF family thiamine/hydroxymethylpyrimidine-binding protein [Gammaproteobacteria bacterium]|jgi:uncharacterized protein YqgV (UPF0045/DUF77 family)
MNITAEISMYPIREDYLAPIEAVIAKLNSYAAINVATFTTATTLIGDYADVMTAITETVAFSYAEFGTCVFVVKLIPGYEPTT